MEKRVELDNAETENMPVPELEAEKSEEQVNGEQEDSGDDREKEDSLPAVGRLALNVKAVPYIPKQDGVAIVPKEGDHARGEAEDDDDTTEEIGESLESRFESNKQGEGETCKGQKFLDEKKIGEEDEKEELRAEVLALKQDVKHYEEIIGQYQASEQTRKRNVDSALISAREVVERERREKMDVLSDQKTKQEQLDHLSKTLNILQAENEELKKLRRQQDEKLAELTRLKTLIQENGFPNIDQFLMLQQQIDSFRDDFFTERKERERLQSQKDKMKREHEVAQSRIASLQEQVFKYREHILFIQNKVSKSSPFRPLPFHDTGNKRPTSANEACKLYGPNATQYINHGLPSPINPVSGGLAGGDSKFRNDKKAYQIRVGEAGGRPWQDGRMQRQITSGEEWRRQQQSNRNGYLNNNVNRLPTSSSAPSLAEMASGEQSPDVTFFDKPYAPKSGFQRKTRFSFNEDASKEFGMPPGDWSKQPTNNQPKRFPSPLASPSLPAQTPEFWSPQQGPGVGFQKGWHNSNNNGQDEIFRFPSSPLSTPTSKGSFEFWPSPSSLVPDEQSVFPPAGSSAGCDEANLFPLASPSAGRPGSNFGRFQQGQVNGKVYVCYNCGINFDDNETHRRHVETCRH